MVDLETIEKKVGNRIGKPLEIIRRYAVLLPLILHQGELHILYEVRGKHLDTQPGEISFPGGSVECGESYREAAIRETSEELNIEQEKITIIGELDYIVSPYNFIIYPYVGLINGINSDDIDFNKEEVDHIFTVPLDFLINSEPILHHAKLDTLLDEDFPYHMIQNGKNYNWRKGKYPIYFYEYEEYIIWGMTARFTKNFVDILKGNKE